MCHLGSVIQILIMTRFQISQIIIPLRMWVRERESERERVCERERETERENV